MADVEMCPKGSGLPKIRCPFCNSEPLKEAVKPEPSIEEIARRHMLALMDDGSPSGPDEYRMVGQSDVRGAIKAALTEYADALKE